jgi:hypothetical protein
VLYDQLPPYARMLCRLPVGLRHLIVSPFVMYLCLGFHVLEVVALTPKVSANAAPAVSSMAAAIVMPSRIRTVRFLI